MSILEPASYPSLQHLACDAPHDLAVTAILAGDAAGRVYVDDTLNPRLALVSPHWGRLYLLGRAGAGAASEIRELLREVVAPAACVAGASVFTLAYPPDWEAYVSQVLEGKRAVQAERQYYRWAGDVVPRTALPTGFAFLPADANLLAGDRIADLQLLRDEMASERASVNDFLARSFGLAAVYESQLAGWCLSEYNCGTRCEVGIAALELFQRRGLATAMGRAFLNLARTSGIREVGWHCWKQNAASAATALRIGLEHVADTPVYLAWYR
jgi:hypothetical protein